MKANMRKQLLLAVFMVAVLASLMPAIPVKATPSGSLVGLWHFDQGIGSTAEDSSTYGNHGTLSGGKFGNALKFDGDDYVQVDHSTSMDVSDYYTFEAWVYLTDDSDYRGLFRRGVQGVLASELEIYIHPGWAGRKLVVAHNRAGVGWGYRYYYTAFPMNQWVHLAVA